MNWWRPSPPTSRRSRAEVLATLVAAIGHDDAVFAATDDRLEPLCGLWRVETCGAVLRARLRGRRTGRAPCPGSARPTTPCPSRPRCCATSTNRMTCPDSLSADAVSEPLPEIGVDELAGRLGGVTVDRRPPAGRVQRRPCPHRPADPAGRGARSRGRADRADRERDRRSRVPGVPLGRPQRHGGRVPGRARCRRGQRGRRDAGLGRGRSRGRGRGPAHVTEPEPRIARWVDDTDTLRSVVATAAEAPRYALDTEFHRERSYYPKLALVQLAWADELVLIDPLAIDIKELVPLFARPGPGRAPRRPAGPRRPHPRLRRRARPAGRHPARGRVPRPLDPVARPRWSPASSGSACPRPTA